MKWKKWAAAVVAVCLAFSLAGCRGSDKDSGEAGNGKVYFLNFKPEQEAAYQSIAKAYTDATGVKVKVVTAAANTYEQQLKGEIAKKDAPTIFQINGPVGYASWKNYCADLKDSTLYSHLLDKSIAITEGDGVYGIPLAVEGYGIIVNRSIMDKYFALSDAKAKSLEEIVGFDKLKAVVEDMQAKRDALGIKGVFASTSLAPGEDWRWQTHLANVPLYYEFQKNQIDLTNNDQTAEITFEYGNNYKALFDLYCNNSITEKGLLGSKTVNDSMAEFALGQCAMVQNGNWAYSQVSDTSGNVVKAEDVAFLPLYMGIEGEDKQGLCIGTENFLCINKNASEADRKASLDFLEWLFTSSEGKGRVTKDLGFIAPFDTFTDADKPSDPLAASVLAWSEREGVTNLPWNFTVFPSQTFKDNFGAKLLEYVQGRISWNDVAKYVVEGWKTEKQNAAG